MRGKISPKKIHRFPRHRKYDFSVLILRATLYEVPEGSPLKIRQKVLLDTVYIYIYTYLLHLKQLLRLRRPEKYYRCPVISYYEGSVSMRVAPPPPPLHKTP